jgi:hypothetical protein
MLTGQATPVRAADQRNLGWLHSFTDYVLHEKAAGEPAASSL